MQAGRLRHIVSIEALTGSTPDGYGNVRQSWTAVFSNVPAEVRPLSSREQFNADRAVTRFTHRIVLRYLPGLTTQHRVRFNGRVFTITGIINPKERNVSLELDVVESA